MGASPPTPAAVRYAILGTGLMGVEHLRNLLTLADDGAGVAVTALADPEPSSLAAAAAAWADHHAAAAAAAARGGDRAATPPPPLPPTYASGAALYAAGGFDVLVVASPNWTHAAVVAAAMAALPPTTHLLVEKPLCTTVGDCRAMVADAKGASPSARGRHARVVPRDGGCPTRAAVGGGVSVVCCAFAVC